MSANSPSIDDVIAERLDAFQNAIQSGDHVVDAGAPPDLPENARRIYDECRGVLELLATLDSNRTAAFSFPPEGREEPRAASDARSLPPRIGRFEVVELLGSGGFGSVYLARDPLTRRLLALKIPRPEFLASGERSSRFEQESRAAARLDHPNIVPVLEAGTAGLVPYIATAFVRGVNLSKWMRLRDKPVFPRDAAEIVQPLAEALAHAHERGVLHRDITPANILLAETPRSAGGPPKWIPKLLDFGLAKCLDGSQELTRTGTLVGTFRYMSPEQAAGNVREVGFRSDVYSLGAVLYELLTGRPPFLVDSDLELLRQIRETEPVRVRQLAPTAPEELETICMKCLEKEPKGRYASAADLAADLDRYLTGRPIHARPANVIERAGKWARRKPTAAALLAVIFLSAVTLFAVLAWSNHQQRRINRDLKEQRDIAEFNAHEVQRREGVLRRRLYLADVQAAGKSFNQDNATECLSLLCRQIPGEGQEDLRDAAWWMLWNHIQQSSTLLGSHEGQATAVAASPTEMLAASAGEDGVVRLWDLAGLKPLAELRGHEGGSVNGVDFSPDGRLLLSAGDDKSVRIWDVRRRAVLRTIRGDSSWVAVARFSPDGKRIACGGADKVIRLWNTADGEPAGELAGHAGTVRALAFGRAGSLLASSDESGEVRMWDLRRRDPDPRVNMKMPTVPSGEWFTSLAFGPGEYSEFIHGVNTHGQIFRWDTRDSSVRRPIHVHGERYGHGLRGVSPCGSDRLAFGVSTGVVRFGEADRNGTFVHHALLGHAAGVMDTAPTIDGGLVTCSRDRTVRYWPRRVVHGETSVRFHTHLNPPAWRAEALFAATRLDLRVVRQSDGSVLAGLPTDADARFAASLDGRTLYFADGNGLLAAMSLPGLTKLWERRLPGRATFLDESGTPPRLLAGCGPKLQVIAPRDGTVERSLEHPMLVHHAAMLAGRPFLWTACADGRLREWDLGRAEVLREKKVEVGAVRSFALEEARGRFAVGGDDRVARILRLDDWSVRESFPHDRVIDQVAFVDDGRLLAVSAREDGLYLWRIDDRAELVRFPSNYESAAAVSPDGRRIVFQIGGFVRILDGRASPLPTTKASLSPNP